MEKILNVFISQPFTNFTKEEVLKIREEAKEIIEKKYPDILINFIDNLECYDLGNNLKSLALSLNYLSKADVAYFIDISGDKFYNDCVDLNRACGFEFRICRAYRIPTERICIRQW